MFSRKTHALCVCPQIPLDSPDTRTNFIYDSTNQRIPVQLIVLQRFVMTYFVAVTMEMRLSIYWVSSALRMDSMPYYVRYLCVIIYVASMQTSCMCWYRHVVTVIGFVHRYAQVYTWDGDNMTLSWTLCEGLRVGSVTRGHTDLSLT